MSNLNAISTNNKSTYSVTSGDSYGTFSLPTNWTTEKYAAINLTFSQSGTVNILLKNGKTTTMNVSQNSPSILVAQDGIPSSMPSDILSGGFSFFSLSDPSNPNLIMLSMPTIIDNWDQVSAINFVPSNSTDQSIVYNPDGSTIPFITINGLGLIGLDEYLKYSGFSSPLNNATITQYNSTVNYNDYKKVIGNYIQCLQSGDYTQLSSVISALNGSTTGSVVIPTSSQVKIMLSENITSTSVTMSLQPISFKQYTPDETNGYLGWAGSAAYANNTQYEYMSTTTPTQSVSVNSPSSGWGTMYNNGLYFVAWDNLWSGTPGTWNPSYWPSSGNPFANGSMVLTPSLSINTPWGINWSPAVPFTQNISSSDINFTNGTSSSGNNFIVSCTGLFTTYSGNADWGYIQIDDYYSQNWSQTFSRSIEGISFNFSKSDFKFNEYSTITGLYNAGYNSNGLLTNSSPILAVSVIDYYYICNWYTYSTWTMVLNGPFPVLNGFGLDFTSGLASSQSSVGINITSDVYVPIVNFVSFDKVSNVFKESAMTDVEKIANKYYNLGDLTVSTYYNHVLQLVDVYMNQNANNPNSTLLYNFLQVASNYGMIGSLITEWINNHPFSGLPQATQAIASALNVNLDLNSANSLVDELFSTTLPGSVTGVDLCKSSASQYDQAAADNIVYNGDAISVSPASFRFILKNTLATAALLDHVNSQVQQLAHIQGACSNFDNNYSLPEVGTTLNNTQNALISLVGTTHSASFSGTQNQPDSKIGLIYPSTSEVTGCIATYVDQIRELFSDRIFGMSENTFNQELTAIVNEQSSLTHEALSMFLNTVKTVKGAVTPIIPATVNMASALAGTALEEIGNPIAYSLMGMVKLLASAIFDVDNLIAPGSEILQIFAEANTLRGIPVAATPIPSDLTSIFSYAVSSTESQFSSIDWLCYSPISGLVSSSNLPPPSDVTTSVPSKVQLNLSSGTINISNLPDGIHKYTILTYFGLVDVWVSTMYQFCNDGAYHRTGSPSIYIIPYPATDLDGKISIPKSFHKFIMSILFSSTIILGNKNISNINTIVQSMSNWTGFNNLSSHVSVNAFISAEAADMGQAGVAATLGATSLLDSTAAKSDFALAAEDVINAVEVGMVYTKAAAVNIFNAVTNNLQQFQSYLSEIWAVDGDVLFPVNAWNDYNHHVYTPSEINGSLPLWYKQSAIFTFADAIYAIGKIAAATWVQNKIISKLSKRKDPNFQNQLKKRSCISIVSGVALGEYHRLKNYGNRKKDLTKLQKQLNSSFMSEPEYEKLSQKDLTGMGKSELQDLQSNEKSLDDILSDMADDIGSRGLN